MTVDQASDAMIGEIEQFLYREARLLDEADYGAWLEMLTDDVTYFVPQTEFTQRADTSRDFVGAHHFSETKTSLEARAAYLMSGLNDAEVPPSQKTRLISNVELLSWDGTTAEVASNFAIWQSRWDGRTDVIMGKRRDRLRRVDGGWQIAAREAHLNSPLLPRAVTVFF